MHHPITAPVTHPGQVSSQPSSHIPAVQLSSPTHCLAPGCSKKFIEYISNRLVTFPFQVHAVKRKGWYQVFLSLCGWHGTVRTQITVVMKVRLRLVCALTGLLMAFQCDVCSLIFGAAYGSLLCAFQLWIFRCSTRYTLITVWNIKTVHLRLG